MQVRDEAAWTQQLLELEADDHTRQFKAFLLFWMETTEKLLVTEPHGHGGNLILGYASPVSKALEIAEQTHGYLSVEWIAQMLLVMSQYWTFGEALYEGLSRIEQRLVDQAAAMKLADLQAGASEC